MFLSDNPGRRRAGTVAKHLRNGPKCGEFTIGMSVSEAYIPPIGVDITTRTGEPARAPADRAPELAVRHLADLRSGPCVHSEAEG